MILDETQARLHHIALKFTRDHVEKQMGHRTSEPYRDALRTQRASLDDEIARIEQTFPRVTNG